MKTINNNIEEKTVGFPNAKLLKEKGFYIDKSNTLKFYHTETELRIWNTIMRVQTYATSLPFEYSKYDIYQAPTTSLAIDWIRINFGIQIFLDYTFYDGFHYGCKVVLPDGNVEEIWVEGVDNDIDGSDTPEEAKEAAINHVLTVLL